MYRRLEDLFGFIGILAVLVLSSLYLTGCAAENATVIGAPAQACTVSPSVAGGALITCPNGTSEYIPPGEAGAAGLAGRDGVDGIDATPITVLQLCPNVVPTYPSVFPEVTFCIQGHLYGTYNGNTAYQYFAELPDGAYSSNGQGAACSFTISGCNIIY